MKAVLSKWGVGGILRRLILLVSVFSVLHTHALFGQEETIEAIDYLPQGTADIVWLVIAGLLVFFMQAGFAMVEAGLTRAKNSSNIMMKNLMDFSLGAIMYWAIGYALMYGEGGSSFIGWDSSLVFLSSITDAADGAGSAGWFFQVVFAATAATIVSGAMAERTKFFTYCIYSIMISAFIYPTTGHWIWGGDGWLCTMGMRDFAGSTVVHSVGAWAALAGAILIGPRKGKYTKDGKVNAIPGHNMPLAALGVFILWFGWYGFNPGSTLAAVDGVAHVAVTTTLGASAGAVAATFLTWIWFKKPDLSMALNGALAGLVAITAPCASVTTAGAVAIGLIGGLLVVVSCWFIDHVLKVDDPVGAISVHGVCGAWGTLSIGLFGSSKVDVLFWDEASCIKDGLFYGGGLSQLGIQALGVVAVFAFTFAVAFALFYVLKITVGLRVSEEEEFKGLDIEEHGIESYPNFSMESDRM